MRTIQWRCQFNLLCLRNPSAAPTHQDVKGSLSTVSVLSGRPHTPWVAKQEQDETANYGEACTAGKEQHSDGWVAWQKKHSTVCVKWHFTKAARSATKVLGNPSACSVGRQDKCCSYFAPLHPRTRRAKDTMQIQAEGIQNWLGEPWYKHHNFELSIWSNSKRTLTTNTRVSMDLRQQPKVQIGIERESIVYIVILPHTYYMKVYIREYIQNAVSERE